MIITRKTSLSSLFVLCALCSVLCDAQAAQIRTPANSRSYADAYNQVAAVQQQAAYLEQKQAEIIANPTENLPVRVANADLAARIARGDTNTDVLIEDLESCAAIYPSGKFAWDQPTAGIKAGQSSQCVALVEMRVIKGTDDILVAHANIASGDSIECNIEKFPTVNYLPAAYEVTFPADNAPTMEEVVNVMNKEQAKNAGMKIAAGMVIGGLLGNASGKNDLGHDGIIGTDKGKMQNTAIGALGGAALMAGSAYSGKVAGDIIMSAGVNGAAGAVIGNVLATGDSVLRIEDCGAQKCLWGIIQKSESLKDVVGFYDFANNNTMVCKPDGNGFKGCEQKSLIGFTFENSVGKEVYKSVEEGRSNSNFHNLRTDSNYTKYELKTDNTMAEAGVSGSWVRISGGGTVSSRIPAMVKNYRDKTFGIKMSDWYKTRNDINDNNIVGRNNKGEEQSFPDGTNPNKNDFYPLTIDAEDGGIIDISNKARAKATLTGAGAGAALGGFSAYQGATDEIDQRWLSAVQEYKDSLQKIYCGTGGRFLSKYNDIAIIPNIK